MGIFAGMFWQEATLKPFVGEAVSGLRGATTYGTAVSYPCRVELKTRRVVGPDGHDQLSSGRVIFEGDITLTLRSELTLPIGYSPQKPRIMSIEKNAGPFGDVGETVVYF